MGAFQAFLSSSRKSNACGSLCRTPEYDTSLAACLTALVFSGRPGTVEYSAHMLVPILHPVLRTTESRELKLAICDVFLVILKCCPSYAEQPELLFPLLPIPEISSPISHCIQHIVESVPALGAPGDIAAARSKCQPGERSSGGKTEAEPKAEPEPKSRSKRRRVIEESETVEVAVKPQEGGREPSAEKIPSTLASDQQSVVDRFSSHILACGPEGQVAAEAGADGALTALRVLARPLSRKSGTACCRALESVIAQWVTCAVNKVRTRAFLEFMNFPTRLLHEVAD